MWRVDSSWDAAANEEELEEELQEEDPTVDEEEENPNEEEAHGEGVDVDQPGVDGHEDVVEPFVDDPDKDQELLDELETVEVEEDV